MAEERKMVTVVAREKEAAMVGVAALRGKVVERIEPETPVMRAAAVVGQSVATWAA